MDLSDIKEEITEIIIDISLIELDELTDDASLTHDLGFDSLDILEIIMTVEDEFNISIEDYLWNKDGVNSVSKIAKIVESKLKVDA